MKKGFIMLLTSLMMLLSCTAFASTDLSGGTIQADGYGLLGQTAPMGYRAAIVDAQRNLLEQVKGAQVTADTTVENMVVASDVIRSRVSGLVRGAKVILKEKTVDGYHVVLEMPIYGAGSLAETALSQAALTSAGVPQTLPYYGAPVQAQPAGPATGGYTGVIVDCSGMGLDTAMAPAIFTPDHQVVYGLESFSRSQAVNSGYVGYAKSPYSGVDRAGNNPLIVRAVAIDRYVSPVISTADAGRILAENQLSGFFAQGKVVFVR